MSFFDDDTFRIDLLRKYAWNRWGALAEDMIPLTAADPDFQIAPEIRGVVKEFGSDGVFSYGEAYGNRDFREVSTDTVRARKKIPCSYEDVLVTNGVTQAIMLVARYACGPGDEAVLFDPVDFLFGKTNTHAPENNGIIV